MPIDLFKPVFTDAGRAAVAAAHGQGLSAKITAIALGAAGWQVRDEEGYPTEPAAAATQLNNEILRVPVAAGGAVSPSQVLVVAQVPAANPPDSPEFWVKELGFILEDGTLLAVTSHETLNIGYRGSVAPWVFRFVLSWSDMPADSIVVVFDGDAGLAAMALNATQLEAQLRHLVQGTGAIYDRAANSQVTAAVASIAGGTLAAVRKPEVIAPAAGAVDIGETPTIQGSSYFSLYGVAHDATEVELATDAGFAAIVYQSGPLDDVTSHPVPAETLDVDTTYYVRLRYQDAEGVWSAWSEASSFSTGETFVSVAQPTTVSPANDATGVVMVPTLQSSAFAVNGGADTHDASEWQIDTAAGDFSAPYWTSGVDGSALTSKVASTASLNALTTYKWRVRHRGQTHGWSPWSVPASFTTQAPAGTSTLTTPGDGTFTVPAGVYSIRETVIGGGGGGGEPPPSGRGSGGAGGGGARRIRTVVPGQVINYTVAAGGSPNQSGETSSIDGQISATGGGRGYGNTHTGDAPGEGFGGDENGTGGGRVGESGGNAVTIGGGGGAMQGGGGTRGAGAGEGGDGGDAGNAPQTPGGGGRGCVEAGTGAQPGAPGMVKFEWGPGI